MDIQRRLGRWLVEHHPGDAASVLMARDDRAVADLFAEVTPAAAGRVLAHLGPTRASAVTAFVEDAALAKILATLSQAVAAGIVRRLAAGRRESFLGSLSPEDRQIWSTALAYGEKTAGGMMDPDVLAMPPGLSVQEAIRQLEARPERSSFYLYVVDEELRLLGVMDLRELFLAGRKQPLAAIMNSEVETLSPRATALAITRHPGWRRAHALPVVDEGRHLLGAIRYQTVRQLEAEGNAAGLDAGTATVAALSDLFWTGIAGLAGAIGSSTPAKR